MITAKFITCTLILFLTLGSLGLASAPVKAGDKPTKTQLEDEGYTLLGNQEIKDWLTDRTWVIRKAAPPILKYHHESGKAYLTYKNKDFVQQWTV